MLKLSKSSLSRIHTRHLGMPMRSYQFFNWLVFMDRAEGWNKLRIKDGLKPLMWYVG